MASPASIVKAFGRSLRNSGRNFVRRRSVWPQVGKVNFGDLGQTEPVGRSFGLERGGPIDRFYIEKFLQEFTDDIGGVGLEIAEDRYLQQFGGKRLQHADILHYDGTDCPEATIIGDLCDLPQVPDNSYDCFILTQTLQYIFEPSRAVAEIQRILKPGGVCLCSCSGITQISDYDQGNWGEYWRFTEDSMTRLFTEGFGADAVKARSYGNVYSAVAFLEGLGMEDVEIEKLDIRDPAYQMVVCVRAQKAARQ